MKKVFLVIAFIAPISCFSQTFIEQFLDERTIIFNYDDVPFDWKMAGDVQMHLNHGINRLKENEPNLAEVSLSSAIKLDSTLWVAFYYRGITAKLQHKLNEAKTDFLTSARLNSKAFEPLIELGKIFRIEGDLYHAKLYYEKANKLYPNKPIALLLLGDLEIQNNNLLLAKEKYEVCLSIDPNFSIARARLGIVVMFLNQKQKDGIPYFNEVIQRDSSYLEAYFLRALVNLKINKTQSLSDFNHLLKVNPGNLTYRFFHVMLLAELEDYEKAFSDFRIIMKATALDENNFLGEQTTTDKIIDIQYAGYYTLSSIYGLPEKDIALVKKAFCLLLIGKYEDGLKSLKKVREYKKSALCLFLLGLGNEHFGLHQEAIKFYNEALLLDNDILDAHKKMGIYSTNFENWEKANYHFTQALRINSQHLPLYKLRGVTHFYLKKYKESINDFTIYLKVDSADRDALKSRAFAYHKIGNNKNACEDYLNTPFIEFDVFKKFVEPIVNSGDTSVAINYLNRFIKRSPAYEAYKYKLHILINHKKWEEANAVIDDRLSYLNPSSSTELYSYFLSKKGIIHLHQNDTLSAEKFFNDAININSRNSEAYLERGRLFFKQGKKQSAKEDFQKAWQLGSQEAKSLLDKI